MIRVGGLQRLVLIMNSLVFDNPHITLLRQHLFFYLYLKNLGLFYIILLLLSATYNCFDIILRFLDSMFTNGQNCFVLSYITIPLITMSELTACIYLSKTIQQNLKNLINK